MFVLLTFAKWTVSSLVAMGIQQGSAVAAFPADSPETVRFEAASQPLLLERAKVARVLSDPKQWIAQYNSDWLLPTFPELDVVMSSKTAAAAFQKVFSKPGNSAMMQRLIEGGTCNRSDLGEENWNQLADGMTILSNGDRSAMKGGEGTLAMNFQPRVMFRDTSGKLVFELNGLRCPKALEGLSKLFGQAREGSEEDDRCPSNLLQKTAAGRIAAPPEGKFYDVEALADEIARASHLPLYVDRRLHGMQIALASKGGTIDYRKAMTLMPTCLNMYWRPVGSVWMLACSPRSPWDEASKRKRADLQVDIAKLGGVAFSEGDPRSKYAYRQWMNTGATLGALSQTQTEGLSTMLTSCATSEDQAKFRQLSADGTLNSKVSLEFSMGFVYKIDLPSGSSATFISNH